MSQHKELLLTKKKIKAGSWNCGVFSRSSINLYKDKTFTNVLSPEELSNVRKKGFRSHNYECDRERPGVECQKPTPVQYWKKDYFVVKLDFIIKQIKRKPFQILKW